MNLQMLVADDHRLFIDGIKLVLHQQSGVNVIDFALTGKDAIDKCRDLDVDLVLMDINMPVINGFEATREIKRIHPHVKVIMLSMLDDYGSVAKALKAGADGYLVKNSGTDELLRAIQTVLKGETYLAQHLAQLFTKDSIGKITNSDDYIRFSENLVSPRERDVLKLISEGYTDEAIGHTLNISDKTVSTHRKNMLAKLQLPNTAALVKFAIENKLID